MGHHHLVVHSTNGNIHRTIYFFVKANPIQFRVCAVFQLSIDFLIVAQRLYYGAEPREGLLSSDIDDLEAALRLEGEVDEIEDNDDEPLARADSPVSPRSPRQFSRFREQLEE